MIIPNNEKTDDPTDMILEVGGHGNEIKTQETATE